MSLPYYSMYPKDFDSDEKVRLMDDDELGLYLRCMNHSWENGGLPPGDDDVMQMMRRGRDTEKSFARKWSKVSLCFPVGEDGRRRNPRQERERAIAAARMDRAVRAGEASARSRSSNSKSTRVERKLHFSSNSNDVLVEPRAYDSDSDSSSVEVCKENQEWAFANFREFVRAWPNPTGVDEAGRQWLLYCEQGILTESNTAEVFTGLERWKTSRLWAQDNGKFRPRMDRWLREKRWLDMPEQKGDWD